MFKLVILFWNLFVISSAVVKFEEVNVVGNTGNPVFVTPYLELKQVDYARSNCTVPHLKGNISDNCAGFFTVKENDKFQSNLFFWYFGAQNKDPNAPVLLWLQGGPDLSSMYGVFQEHGPFYLKPSNRLGIRKHSWIETMNVIYIDSPVGSGFSFTTSDEGYSRTLEDMVINLVNAVNQFYLLYPELRNNDFYITGESYAGNVIPYLAYYIDKSINKRKKDIRIHLKGIAIGNGLYDPINMMSYSSYLKQIGLIDDYGYNKFYDMENEITQLHNQKHYLLAFNKFDAMIKGELFPYNTLFYNLTGFSNYFNYRFSQPYNDDETRIAKLFQTELIRKALHVGNCTFHNGLKAKSFLVDIFFKSSKDTIEKLLEKNYKVLLYSGQLDVLVGYPSTLNFIKKLNWSGKNAYSSAVRQQFVVNNEVAGYYKQDKNLIEVLILDAGHKVPKDQPQRAFELIYRFSHNKPL